MPASPPAPPQVTPPLQPGRPPASATPAGGIAVPLLAWAVSLALVAVVATLLLRHQDAVVAAWPPMARLFSALGLR
jgi:hypothetical protein